MMKDTQPIHRWVLPQSSVGNRRVTCSCARVSPDFERRSSFVDAGWAEFWHRTRFRIVTVRQPETRKDRTLKEIGPECCQLVRRRTWSVLYCVRGHPELVELVRARKTSAFDAVASQTQCEFVSVSSGDGRNPSPLGEEKIVVLWSRASLQARSAHENGPKSAHRLDTEIS